LSVIGVPGALLAGWMVEWPYFGRKGTLALSTGVFPSYSIYVSHAHTVITVLTGVFLFASTTARTSPALLGWNCGYSFTSNVMYGVLYALSPELFPSPVRGTGNAVVAVANRVFGIMVSSSHPTAKMVDEAMLMLCIQAPIVALYADLTTSVPIFVSGALFLVAGLIALLLPYEPRGKAAL
jgi:MFS family permease